VVDGVLTFGTAAGSGTSGKNDRVDVGQYEVKFFFGGRLEIDDHGSASGALDVLCVVNVPDERPNLIAPLMEEVSQEKSNLAVSADNEYVHGSNLTLKVSGPLPG